MTRTNQEVLSVVGHVMQLGQLFTAWPLHKDDRSTHMAQEKGCRCGALVFPSFLGFAGYEPNRNGWVHSVVGANGSKAPTAWRS